MNIIGKFKEIYQITKAHKYLFWIVELPYFFRKYWLSDEKIVKKKYERIFEKKGDFKNPQTINEVIHYRKLYDRKEHQTNCTDKFLVREIVEKIIGGKYLIPLLFVHNKVSDINFELLPQEFIIKINHGSGQNILVRDKNKLDKSATINQLEYWFKKNHYFNSREWQYKNIVPKVLIEKLILDANGNVPSDYKFHCINGKLEFIQVFLDRFGDQKRVFYSREWEEMPFIWSPIFKDGSIKYNKSKGIKKPKMLSEMIEVAEKLAQEFYYIRVDLYQTNDRIYFGELTFSHMSGFAKFFPAEWDLFYGQKINWRNESKKGIYEKS